MNYYEWAEEYFDTANLINDTIKKLKSQHRTANAVNKKELNLKIAKYRNYYNEAIQTANHLLERAGGLG
ncbi:MAG: hypothetical protein U0L20_02855 [Ruminococcus sp.]|nr:hypothetical protein [Ruminococcus sp.]